MAGRNPVPARCPFCTCPCLSFFVIQFPSQNVGRQIRRPLPVMLADPTSVLERTFPTVSTHSVPKTTKNKMGQEKSQGIGPIRPGGKPYCWYGGCWRKPCGGGAGCSIMGGPWGRASGPGPGGGGPYIDAGVVGSDGPADSISVICPMPPMSLGSVPSGFPLPAAFSAFLIASVVRRFATAPCISPEAHRPWSC